MSSIPKSSREEAGKKVSLFGEEVIRLGLELDRELIRSSDLNIFKRCQITVDCLTLVIAAMVGGHVRAVVEGALHRADGDEQINTVGRGMDAELERIKEELSKDFKKIFIDVQRDIGQKKKENKRALKISLMKGELVKDD